MILQNPKTENEGFPLEKFYATGKRKSSVARVWLKKSINKRISVNNKNINSYFFRELDRINVQKPLKIIRTLETYEIICNVSGGGISSQSDAIKHGISKVLYLIDKSHKKDLKKNKLLTRDSRIVERKKYGQPKARKKFQFSKR